VASGIVETSEKRQEEEQKQQQSQGAGQRAPLVQRLLEAPSLPAFINDLLVTQATTVAGTEAAGFLIERGDGEGFNLRQIAHLRPDNAPADKRAAAIQAFVDLVKPCVEQGKDGAIELNAPADLHEAQYCLVTLLRSDGNAVAVSAVVTRCLNLERAKMRLQSMQLVAGYFELFTLRHNAEQARMIAQSHQHVLQLATAVATAEGFDSAAMNLCNELATRAGATRVSMGWLKGRNIKVRALSHTEEFDKKQELIVMIERVMEECADQEQFVHYDPNGKGTDNVSRDAQNFSRMQGGHIVLSLPLRRRAEVCGVITLEFLPNTKLGPQVAHGLAVAVELLAPQLYDRWQNDRWLITKVGISTKDVLAKGLGTKYTLAKLIVLLVVIGLGIIVQPWWQPMYHVAAPFEFNTPDKIVVSAPMEAYLLDVATKPDGEPLRPGDRVTAGQKLAVFNTFDLQAKLQKATSERAEAESEMLLKRSQNKIAEYNAAQARRDAANADQTLYQYEIDHATITAPYTGTILKGDLSEKQHARFQQGETMFEIARTDALRTELTVAERDIQDLKVGAAGMVATSSLPMDKYPFHVIRIIPLGEPKEGSNNFLVYGQMDKTPEVEQAMKFWRPGMAGEARVDVGHRRIVWIWTHRLVDFLRLKLWNCSWSVVSCQWWGRFLPPQRQLTTNH
jgi:hypothetical protein